MTGALLVLAVAVASQEVFDATKSPQCMECHAEVKEEEWAGSIHEKKGIACVDCHGPDTIRPKQNNPHTEEFSDRIGRKVISELCAKCHKTEFDEFKGGNHATVRNCLSCHENHKTKVGSFAALRKNCERCHVEDQAGTKGLEDLPIFEDGILRAEKAADDLAEALRAFLLHPEAKDLAELREKGHPEPGLSAREAWEAHDLARSQHQWLRQFQHAAKTEEFRVEADKTEKDARDAIADLAAQVESKERRPMLLLAFLVVVALNLVLLRKWLKAKFGGDSGAAVA